MALARRISAAERGRSRLVLGEPGICSGASQKAFHFSRSTTSGVSWIPSSRSGAICCSESRRRPLTTSNSGVRSRASVDQARAGLVNGKLADDGLAVVDGERGAQLFAALALPGESEFVIGHGGAEAVQLVVFAKVAVEGLRGRGKGREQHEYRGLKRQTGST